MNLAHNHQGLLTGLTNAYGEIYRSVFDVRDRAIWQKSSAGVWTTNTFDGLDRVLTSLTAIGNAERFGYGPAGLVAYTNQMDEITRWVHDADARLLRVTNQNQEVLQFAYNPANNLTNLFDGKNAYFT